MFVLKLILVRTCHCPIALAFSLPPTVVSIYECAHRKTVTYSQSVPYLPQICTYAFIVPSDGISGCWKYISVVEIGTTMQKRSCYPQEDIILCLHITNDAEPQRC